jgi:hypothetical protein
VDLQGRGHAAGHGRPAQRPQGRRRRRPRRPTYVVRPSRDSNNRGNTYPPSTWLADPHVAANGNYPAWDCKSTGAPGDGSQPASGPPAPAPGSNEACWVAPALPGAAGPSQIPHILAKHYPSR